MSLEVRPKIGYVVNPTRDGISEIWFYKRVLGKWVRVQRERISDKDISYFLDKLFKKADLVLLGRVTSSASEDSSLSSISGSIQ